MEVTAGADGTPLETAKRLKRTRRDKAAALIAELEDAAALSHLAEIDLRFDTAAVMAENPATDDRALWILHRRALAELLATARQGDHCRVLRATMSRLDPELVASELAEVDTSPLDASYHGGRMLFPYSVLARSLLGKLAPPDGGCGEATAAVERTTPRLVGTPPGPTALAQGEQQAPAAITPVGRDRVRRVLDRGPDALVWEVATLVARGAVPGLDLEALVEVGCRTEVVLAAAYCMDAGELSADLARAYVRLAPGWCTTAARFEYFDVRGWQRAKPSPEAGHVLASHDAEWARLWAVRTPLSRADRRAIIEAPSSSEQLLQDLARYQELESDEAGKLVQRALRLRARHAADPLLRALMVQTKLAPGDRPAVLAALAKHGNPGAALSWLTDAPGGLANAKIPHPVPGEIAAFCSALTPRAAKAVVTRLGDAEGLLGQTWASEALDHLPGLCISGSRAVRAAVRDRIAAASLDATELAAVRDLLAGYEGSVQKLLELARRAARTSGRAAGSKAAGTGRDGETSPRARAVAGPKRVAGSTRGAGRKSTRRRPPRADSGSGAASPRKGRASAAPGRRVAGSGNDARSAPQRDASRPPRWVEVALGALAALGGELSAKEILVWNDTAGPQRPHNGSTPTQSINRDLHAAVRSGTAGLVLGTRRGSFRLAGSGTPDEAPTSRAPSR